MIKELIGLSKIFKSGFTVEFKNSVISQYSNSKKPYIVAYKTIITITDKEVIYNHINDLPLDCIIGGWLDKDNNTYYIELNKVFKLKSKALLYAKKYNQKAIYNLKTEEVINV